MKLSKRGVLATAAAMLSSVLLLPIDTSASVGCTAVNGGVFNASLTPGQDRSFTQANFAVGDRLDFTITITGHGHLILIDTSGGWFSSITYDPPTTDARSYTLTAAQLQVTARYVTDSPANLTSVATCVSVTAPTVTSIAPTSGPVAGGTAVTINGTNFTGATAVTVGGVAATGVVVVNATTITASVPAHAAGTVDVAVTTATGTGTGSGLFRYLAAPTVTAVNPTSGPTLGGTAVTITGTAFTGATALTIGGVAATGFVVSSATTITATTPAHAAGIVNVVVTTPGGAGTGTGLYTYVAAPTVTATSPTSGPIAGGSAVTLTGTDFTGTTSVTIGGVAAGAIVVVNATTITATTPAHSAGTADIAVTTASGTGVGTGLFTYLAAPTVLSISPANGPIGGGTAIIITGTDFTGATSVTLGGVEATGMSVIDASTISAIAPAHAAGAVDVAVTTPSGTPTGAGLFTYVAAPTVTAIAPASGPIAGGTAVVITGTNFTGATSVTIGGIAASRVTVVNATTINATAPAHGSGAVNVVITAPFGSGTGTNLYTYVAAPTVSAISPARGTTAGGTRITITGAAFNGATRVTIGGVAATNITVVNSRTVMATTPAHDAGGADVSVTSASGTGTGTYTYISTLVLESTASVLTQVGQGYSQTNVATGGLPRYVYTTSAGSIPAGTTLDASTGLVSGTPTTKGSFNYTIQVTDSGDTALRIAQDVAGVITAVLTSTAVTSSQNPSMTGQLVTLTATVTPASATGSVTFADGGTALCGVMPLASGVATCTTAFAVSGAHAITAAFGGNSAVGASTSMPMVQTVNDQRVKTVEAIGKFLSRRNDLIATNAPDGTRQVDRLTEAGNTDTAHLMPSGQAPVLAALARDQIDGARQGTGPVRISGSSFGTMRFALATSLSQMLLVRTQAQPATSGTGRPKRLPFDVWIDGMYGSFSGHRSTNDLDGHFGLMSIGADYVFNGRLLAGGMVQVDSMRQRSNLQSSDVRGRGWMAGPYATVRLVDNVFLQGRAAWGGSRNDVSPFLSYVDEFETDRRLLSSAVSGRWLAGAWVLRPSATVAYIEDVAASYTDTFGVAVPQVTSRLGQIRVGPDVGYRRQFGPGVVLEPRAGLLIISNFAGDTTAAGLGRIIGENGRIAGTRGRAEAGLRVMTTRGFGIDLSGAYDGIGAREYPSVTGRAMVHVPLK